MFVDWFADTFCRLYDLKMIICQTFEKVSVRVTVTLYIANVHLNQGVSFINLYHGLYQRLD